MNNEKYENFINEQKKYFEASIKPNFEWSWDDSNWTGGAVGSGWLLSRSGRTTFSFQIGKRLKGLDDFAIDKTYQEFMKAVMVLSYRKANSKTSPQKLYAEILILKRWYHILHNNTENMLHPCHLSTLILESSFKILSENSSKANLPDHAGTYFRLQEMLNHYGFTEKPLAFSQRYLYLNQINRTPNAKKTKALINQLELDEDELDKDKLISIRTFINIISLMNLCKTNGEKIILNLFLLLVVTGLRSSEAILLKKDALIKQPIIDPITKKHLTLDGVKQYTFGIQYYGAKNAGFRVHWVEPLAAPLVETIFKSVLDLTKECREHLSYIRSKNCKNFLPKSIDLIDKEYVGVDDLIGTCFGVNNSSIKHSVFRKKILYSLTNIKPYFTETIKIRINKFFLKTDINDFIKNLTNYNSKYPIDSIFNYEGKVIKIPFEDLLFIHEYKSTNLKNDLVYKCNVIPLNVTLINTFLGGSNSTSVFEKYNLLENDKAYSKLTSHIPRHNINTFLALSGLSEHLQAMLMGRVDIKQNQYYQHLALKQRKITASLLEEHELVPYQKDKKEVNPDYPIDSIKHDGLMYFSKKIDLENNLKRNLQTFNSKNEVASYVKESFFDEYFQDIAESFNELVKEDQSLADSLVQRHAYLHPLPFGGCMREVAVHDCPKRLACQSGDQCGNFALTGRKGELETLQYTLNKLLDEFKQIEKIVVHDLSYREMFEGLREKIIYLKNLKTKAIDRQDSLRPISIFPCGNIFTKLPTTLSELFAIEQQKFEIKDA